MRRRFVSWTVLFSALGFLTMLYVPIEYTPIKVFIWHFRTWHKVSAWHLIHILWTPLPVGVQPLGSCERIHESHIQDLLNISQINCFTDAEARLKAAYPVNHESLQAFLPLMSREVKLNLWRTYLTLAKALEKANVPYVILHGSLLGVFRFSSTMPWDDDMDVSINASRWQDVREALSCISGYELMVEGEMRWSFFNKSNEVSLAMPIKKYPFIDIFFYGEDKSHIWGLQTTNRRRSLFPKADMFPYSRAMMNGILVPVPRSPVAILKRQFGNLDLCSSQEFPHFKMRNLSGPIITVPCHELYPVYGNFSVDRRGTSVFGNDF